MKSYLTFTAANLTFAVVTDQIREIITNYSVRPIPKVPDYISGIINLRGGIIPVIDMGSRLGCNQLTSNGTNCIIILQLEEELIGLTVDSVLQVQDLTDQALTPLPTPNNEKLASNLLSLSLGKVALLLDCDALILPQLHGDSLCTR